MNTILTTKSQNNSASPPFLADLIDSASAGNLYSDGQQNEQLSNQNMVESEGGGMNTSQKTIPHTSNTTYLLIAKINRMKIKTDLVSFFIENKVGSLIYFFVLKVLYLFVMLLVAN